MTYFAFLGVFLVPPILVLLLTLRRSLRREHLIALIALAAIALAYTSPWDNYLVIRGVWTFDRERIANWFIWRVPLEEYVFYVLQVLLTGFFTIWLLRRSDLTPRPPSLAGKGAPNPTEVEREAIGPLSPPGTGLGRGATAKSPRRPDLAAQSGRGTPLPCEGRGPGG